MTMRRGRYLDVKLQYNEFLGQTRTLFENHYVGMRDQFINAYRVLKYDHMSVLIDTEITRYEEWRWERRRTEYIRSPSLPKSISIADAWQEEHDIAPPLWTIDTMWLFYSRNNSIYPGPPRSTANVRNLRQKYRTLAKLIPVENILLLIYDFVGYTGKRSKRIMLSAVTYHEQMD